jgi:hypothetical protein
MGIALKREAFLEWVEGHIRFTERDRFFADLQAATGLSRAAAHWKSEESSYLKIGSYTRYGIFILLLTFVAQGDSGCKLEDDENIEREALDVFRRQLSPLPVHLPMAEHFLRTGDSDTVFVPVAIREPFEFEETWVASLPGALLSLQALARELHFSLKARPEQEDFAGTWDAVATGKNIARDIHTYFAKSKRLQTCVSFS